MNDRQNRTIICSILFLDIVEYSRKPVAEQIALRDRFNVLLSDALQGVAASDRVILDTGDGAAISFLGDPEDALFMALTLRDATVRESPQISFQLRLGINLGPVKLVKDLNGRPNIIGDGINVAQRIMSFSQPGQVLVSRSYYEVVSRLSDQYSGLFHYEGSRTDKHVREHEIYSVGAYSPGLIRSVAAYSVGPSRMRINSRALLGRLSQTTNNIEYQARRRPRLVTVLTVFAILATATAMRGQRETTLVPIASQRNAPTQPLALEKPAATSDTVLQPGKGEPAATQPLALQKPAAASDTVLQTGEAEPAATRDEPKSPVVETAKAVAVEAKPKQTPSGQPIVTLAIAPWGEIYVDGIKQGVSPPMRVVKLTPGRQHKIEIRNGSFPSRVETVEAIPGARLTIKHKFQ